MNYAAYLPVNVEPVNRLLEKRFTPCLPRPGLLKIACSSDNSTSTFDEREAAGKAMRQTPPSIRKPRRAVPHLAVAETALLRTLAPTARELISLTEFSISEKSR
jgi:hypothetical protein